MNVIILYQSIDKFLNRLGSLNLAWKLVWEKEISEFKTALTLLKMTLCHCLLVSEGLGKYSESK